MTSPTPILQNCLGEPDPVLIDPFNCPALRPMDAVDVTPTLRAELRFARIVAGFPQVTLALLLNRSRSWVAHIEDGTFRTITEGMLAAWVDACAVNEQAA